MEYTNIYQAKAQLSELVVQAADDHEVIIARDGTPIARITSFATKKRSIHFGVLKGKIEIDDGFDAPLPDDLIAAFAGQ